MYADDTTLFCNIDNNVTEDVINSELFKIYEWLGANKLALKGNATYLKKKLLWMETMHYPNTIRSMVPMAPFTPKSTSKLRSALYISYSIVIPRFISSANTVQSY